MSLDNPQTFGDPERFAIKIRPCRAEYNYTPDSKMAICHLVIGGHLVGAFDEECYLPTWASSLATKKQKIVQNRERLFPKVFEGLSDREIWASILKSNQLEDEFEPEYLYLAQLDNQIWVDHFFWIDETTDACMIGVYVKDEQISFLVQAYYWSKETGHTQAEWVVQKIDLDFFISTVDAVLNYLLRECPYLKDHIK
jgi:hypothetical protein